MSERFDLPIEPRLEGSHAFRLLKEAVDNPSDASVFVPNLHISLFRALKRDSSFPIPPPARALSELWHGLLSQAETRTQQRLDALWDELERIRDDVSVWLDAYAEATGQTDAPRCRPRGNDENYFKACTACLKGQGDCCEVPFVVVKLLPTATGHVLGLQLTSYPSDTPGLFIHPDVAANAALYESSFADSLQESFHLAMNSENASPKVIFWRVVVGNGTPLDQLAESIEGNSATGAAYRGFWHVAHNKLIDDHVYVLGAVSNGAETVSSVGELSAKIEAIGKLQSVFPPLIVVPADLDPVESKAVDNAKRWAEVRTVQQRSHLGEVRSCAVMAALDHLNRLVDKLNPTLECRKGEDGDLKLDDVYQPGHCTITTDEHQTSKTEKPNTEPRSEEKPKTETKAIEAACLDSERSSPILLAGEPGSGKSTALLRVARELAIRGRTQIEQRRTPLFSVDWPYLCDFASWMSHGNDAITSVEKAASSRFPPPKRIDPPHNLRQAALARLHALRLRTYQRATWILLDAYDQRSETHKKEMLAERLNQLLPFFPRFVLSSRPGEHNAPPIPGLLRHGVNPLSNSESISLASSWLGLSQAECLVAELENRNMTHVLESPLLLTATAQLASADEFTLPATTCQLYQKLIESLAVKGLDGYNLSTLEKLTPASLIDALERTAWMLFAKSTGENIFSVVHFRSSLQSHGDPGVTNDQINEYLELFSKCRFIERLGEKTIQFHHTTYLEYLAASHLVKAVEHKGWNSKCLPIWCSDNAWRDFSPARTIKEVVDHPRWHPIYRWMAGHSWDPAPFLSLIIPRDRNPLAPCIKRIQPYFANFLEERPRDIKFQRWQQVFLCYAEIDPNEECHTLVEMIKPGIAVILDTKNASDAETQGESNTKGKLWKRHRFANALSDELFQREGWIAPGVTRFRRIDYSRHHNWLKEAHHGFSISKVTPCESLVLEILGIPKEVQYPHPEELQYQFRGTLAGQLVTLARMRSTTDLLQKVERCIESAHRNKTDECHILAALLKSHDTSVAERALDRMETIFSGGEWSEGDFMFGRLCRSGFESDIQDKFFAFLERIIESVIPSKCETKWAKLDKQLDFLGEIISNWRAREDMATKMAFLIHRLLSIEATMFCVSSELVEFVRLHGTIQHFIEVIFRLFQGIRTYPGTQAGLLHLDYLTEHGFLLPENRKSYLKPVLEDGIGSSCYVYLNVCGMLEQEFGISESEKLAFFSKAADSAINNQSGYSLIAGLIHCLKVSKAPFEESDQLRVAFRSSVISKICRAASDSLDYYPVKEAYRDSVEDHYQEIFPLIYGHEGWSGLRSKLRMLLERPFFRELHTAFQKKFLLKCFVQSTDSIELLECLNRFVRRRNRPLLLAPFPLLYFLKKVQPIKVTDWKQEIISVDWYLLESEREFLSEMIVAILRELHHRKWSFRRRLQRFDVVIEGDLVAREALNLSELNEWE